MPQNSVKVNDGSRNSRRQWVPGHRTRSGKNCEIRIAQVESAGRSGHSGRLNEDDDNQLLTTQERPCLSSTRMQHDEDTCWPACTVWAEYVDALAASEGCCRRYLWCGCTCASFFAAPFINTDWTADADGRSSCQPLSWRGLQNSVGCLSEPRDKLLCRTPGYRYHQEQSSTYWSSPSAVQCPARWIASRQYLTLSDLITSSDCRHQYTQWRLTNEWRTGVHPHRSI